MVETVVTVKVERLPIRLCKVVHGDDHQIVVGGRLVSETRGGTRIPHPDLPEYAEKDFPCDVEAYAYGEPEADGVQVLVQDRAGRMKPVGPVRATTLLFNARGAETVRQWIRQEAAK